MYVSKEMAKRIERYANAAESNEIVFELLMMIRETIMIDDNGNHEIVAHDQDDLEDVGAAQVAASLAQVRRDHDDR